MVRKMDNQDFRLGFVFGLWVAVIVGQVAWFAWGSILNFVSTTISLALVFTLMYLGPMATRRTVAYLREV